MHRVFQGAVPDVAYTGLRPRFPIASSKAGCDRRRGDVLLPFEHGFRRNHKGFLMAYAGRWVDLALWLHDVFVTFGLKTSARL